MNEGVISGNCKDESQEKIAIADSKHDFESKLNRFKSLFSNSIFIKHLRNGYPSKSDAELSAIKEHELFLEILGTLDNGTGKNIKDIPLEDSVINIMDTIMKQSPQIKPASIKDWSYTINAAESILKSSKSLLKSNDSDENISARDFITKLGIEDGDAIVVDAAFISLTKILKSGPKIEIEGKQMKIYYIMSSEILNDPAEKKSCWDILKLKDENHGVDIVPIIEENPISRTYSYATEECGDIDNSFKLFFTKFELTLGAMEESSKNKHTTQVKISDPHYSDDKNYTVLVNNKSENSINMLVSNLIKILTKIYTGKKMSKNMKDIDEFHMNVDFLQKRGGDQLQVLLCKNVKSRNWKPFDSNFTDSIDINTVWFLTHDRPAACLALYLGVNLLLSAKNLEIKKTYALKVIDPEEKWKYELEKLESNQVSSEFDNLLKTLIDRNHGYEEKRIDDSHGLNKLISELYTQINTANLNIQRPSTDTSYKTYIKPILKQLYIITYFNKVYPERKTSIGQFIEDCGTFLGNYEDLVYKEDETDEQKKSEKKSEIINGNKKYIQLKNEINMYIKEFEKYGEYTLQDNFKFFEFNFEFVTGTPGKNQKNATQFKYHVTQQHGYQMLDKWDYNKEQFNLRKYQTKIEDKGYYQDTMMFLYEIDINDISNQIEKLYKSDVEKETIISKVEKETMINLSSILNIYYNNIENPGKEEKNFTKIKFYHIMRAFFINIFIAFNYIENSINEDFQVIDDAMTDLIKNYCENTNEQINDIHEKISDELSSEKNKDIIDFISEDLETIKQSETPDIEVKSEFTKEENIDLNVIYNECYKILEVLDKINSENKSKLQEFETKLNNIEQKRKESKERYMKYLDGMQSLIACNMALNNEVQLVDEVEKNTILSNNMKIDEYSNAERLVKLKSSEDEQLKSSEDEQFKPVKLDNQIISNRIIDETDLEKENKNIIDTTNFTEDETKDETKDETNEVETISELNDNELNNMGNTIEGHVSVVNQSGGTIQYGDQILNDSTVFVVSNNIEGTIKEKFHGLLKIHSIMSEALFDDDIMSEALFIDDDIMTLNYKPNSEYKKIINKITHNGLDIFDMYIEDGTVKIFVNENDELKFLSFKVEDIMDDNIKKIEIIKDDNNYHYIKHNYNGWFTAPTTSIVQIDNNEESSDAMDDDDNSVDMNDGDDNSVDMNDDDDNSVDMEYDDNSNNDNNDDSRNRINVTKDKNEILKILEERLEEYEKQQKEERIDPDELEKIKKRIDFYKQKISALEWSMQKFKSSNQSGGAKIISPFKKYRHIMHPYTPLYFLLFSLKEMVPPNVENSPDYEYYVKFYFLISTIYDVIEQEIMKREERNNEEEIFNNQLKALKLGCLLKLYFYDVNLITEEGSLYYIELDGVISIIRNNLIGYPYKMKDYEIELLSDDTLKNFLNIEDIQKTIETFKYSTFYHFEEELNESISQYEIFIDEINILMNSMYKNIKEDKSDHILSVPTNKTLTSASVSETTEGSEITSNNSSSGSNDSSPNNNNDKGYSTPPPIERGNIAPNFTQKEYNDISDDEDIMEIDEDIMEINDDISGKKRKAYDYDYDDDESVEIHNNNNMGTYNSKSNEVGSPMSDRKETLPLNRSVLPRYSLRDMFVPINNNNPNSNLRNKLTYPSLQTPGGSRKKKTRRKKKKSNNKTRKH